ncbi:unnamed protein product [Clonostachys byssicola]|uniref:Protein SERAC1 n=1 Tax=Clonostachys byssicola TaxID=160290 RepID=A0A9N9UYK9_9HYPO|nr:unnamed protein product [Clonostachys byssicola]
MKRVFQRRESDDKGDTSEGNPEPIGLELWYEGPNAEFDIIFIHGLMGNRNKTWQATGSNGLKLEPWPKALLPAKLPESRIFTFGYDAKVTDTKEFMGKVSEKTLRDHAAELIYSICHQRRASASTDRSLIFVCHSLGGLVCKEVLLPERHDLKSWTDLLISKQGLLFANQRSDYRQIFQSTRGIIFMGTPHHGSEAASYAQHLTNLMSSMKQVNTKLLEALKKDSEMLENIHDDFCLLIREKRQSSMERAPGIVCFFEELPMRALGCVVSKTSATIPGFACRGIHANHKGMTKFSSENDTGFKSFFEELSGFLPPSVRLTVTDLAVCAPKQNLISIEKESDKGKGSCDEAPFDTELSSLSDVSKVARPTTELDDVVDARYPAFNRNFVSTRRACDGCLCFRTVSRESSMVNLFFLKSSGEKVEIAQHQPSCRFRNQMRILKRSQTVEFRGNWISWRIAFHLTTANHNINRSISCVKVLGEDAPALKLYESSLALSRNPWDATYSQKFVTQLAQHILRLHREGRASISDVCLNGLTGLDMIMDIFFQYNISFTTLSSGDRLSVLRVLMNLLDDLRFLGKLPKWKGLLFQTKAKIRQRLKKINSKFISTILGKIDVMHIYNVFYFGLTGEIQGLFKKLILLGWDLNPELRENSTSEGSGVLFAVQHHYEILEDHVKSPVTAAISARDYDQLREVLRKDPACAAEYVDSLGVSCLALSTLWPRGFKLMLDAFASTNPIERHPSIVAEAIYLVREYHLDNCTHGECKSGDDGTGNHHFEHTILGPLIGLGIPCRFHQILREARWFGRFCYFLDTMFFTTLKSQREELKALGLRHLSQPDIVKYGLLEDSILDGQAGLVTAKLHELGVPVSEVLYVPLDYHSVHRNLINHPHRSDRLEYLWQIGFRDINGVSMSGAGQDCIDISFASVSWYIRHGVDLNVLENEPQVDELSETGTLLASHITSWKLAVDFCNSCNSLSPEVVEVLLEICGWTALDCCRCQCSPLGCSAFKVFFHHVFSFICKHGKKTSTKGWPFPSSLNEIFKAQRLQIVRFMTFQELDIPHTCCTRVNRRISDVDLDEAREINEEYRLSIDQLNSLVAEFEDVMEEEGFSIGDFINNHWAQKMEEVKRSHAEIVLTSAELDGAREIGVTWGPVLAEETDVLTTEIAMDKKLQRWLNEMDSL